MQERRCQMSAVNCFTSSVLKYAGTAVFACEMVRYILATNKGHAENQADALQKSICGIALIGAAAILDDSPRMQSNRNEGG